MLGLGRAWHFRCFRVDLRAVLEVLTFRGSTQVSTRDLCIGSMVVPCCGLYLGPPIRYSQKGATMERMGICTVMPGMAKLGGVGPLGLQFYLFRKCLGLLRS